MPSPTSLSCSGASLSPFSSSASVWSAPADAAAGTAASLAAGLFIGADVGAAGLRFGVSGSAAAAAAAAAAGLLFGWAVVVAVLHLLLPVEVDDQAQLDGFVGPGPQLLLRDRDSGLALVAAELLLGALGTTSSCAPALPR
eukprot:8311787-Pyramimonas_sp.AAC.1